MSKQTDTTDKEKAIRKENEEALKKEYAERMAKKAQDELADISKRMHNRVDAIKLGHRYGLPAFSSISDK